MLESPTPAEREEIFGWERNAPLRCKFTGAAGGIRTHDIQNHNLALLPAELQPPYNRQFNIPANDRLCLHQADWVHIDNQCRCTPAFVPGVAAKFV
jgi:hypothetical protein